MPKRRLNQIAKSIRVLIDISEKFAIESKKYTNKEKNLVQEFIDVLKIFNKQNHPTENKVYRKELKGQMVQYRSMYVIGNIQYISTPFLWFTCTFFETLSGMLISEKQFFPILLDILREFTKLIKKGIPLEEKDHWEALQYRSNTKIFPFIDQVYGKELKILQGFHELLDDGLVALNPRRIIEIIRKELEKGNIPYRELYSTFFDLIGPKWAITFNKSSFDLEEYYCKFKLIKAEDLDEIFDFSTKSTLNMSQVYQIADYKEKEYIGKFIVPKNKFSAFQAYLMDKEDKGQLKILSIKKITNSEETVSYHYYDRGKGWIYDNSIELVGNKHLSTGIWDTDCQYSKQKNYIDYIKSINVWVGENYFTHLSSVIGDLNTRQEKTRLFRDHTERMNKMYEDGVLRLNLTPKKLIDSFALNDYLITLAPNQWEKESSKLLSLLPSASVYYLEDKTIRIFTIMNKQLLNLCNKKLGVYCKRIVYTKYQAKPNLSAFNEEKMKWELNM